MTLIYETFVADQGVSRYEMQWDVSVTPPPRISAYYNTGTNLKLWSGLLRELVADQIYRRGLSTMPSTFQGESSRLCIALVIRKSPLGEACSMKDVS